MQNSLMYQDLLNLIFNNKQNFEYFRKYYNQTENFQYMLRDYINLINNKSKD